MVIKKVYITLFLLIGFSAIVFSQQKSFSTQAINGKIIISGPDTVCAGSSGFMTLTGASSSPAKWQVSSSGGLWSDINNTNTTNTYFKAQNNLCYRVILVNGDTSQTTCLTVDDLSNAGTISGGGSFCNSASGKLITSGSNGIPSGWYLVNGNTYSTLSNTTTSQNFNNLTQASTYAFMTKNGVCPADTSIVTINIDPLPHAGTLSGSTSVCSSSNTGTISASGFSGKTKQWQYSTNNGSTWLSLTDTTNTYTYKNLTQSTIYHLIAKSGVCPADTSNSISITVDQLPIGGSISGGGKFCGITASGTLQLNWHFGTIQAWQSSVDNGSTWTNTSCSGSSCAYSNITQPTIYRVAFNSGACPSVYSKYDTVIYSSSSKAGSLVSPSDSICIGDTLKLSLSGYTGNHFKWLTSINGGINWSNLSFTNSSANIILTVNSQYKVIVNNNNCPADTSNIKTITVIVAPQVNISNNDTTIEQGQEVIIKATGNGVPSWWPIKGLSSGSGFATTATPFATTVYYIKVSLNGCSNQDSIVIKVNPGEYKGLIANTLTPNGDGINDAFFIENIESFTNSELRIFNEYGQQVYSAQPYLNDWKGTYKNTRLPDGTYYYVLKFADQTKQYKGTITLMSQP